MQSAGVALAVLAGALVVLPACHKDEPPPPTAEPVPEDVHGKGKLSLRNPMASLRIDPQAMKDYRLDVCYYGTFALYQARDSYFASLGKDEPSEKKIPSFGIGANGSATPSPAASASAAPAAGSAKAGAKHAKPAAAAPSASASASAAPSAQVPAHRAFDFARAPYERNARACSAAAALREPAMGDVDTAVRDFAPFAVDLAKDIVAANQYYAKKEYEQDGFEKGKQLHKKLVEGFAKLDDLHDKLGKALTGWRSAHAPDASKWEPGQKLAASLLEDGKTIVSTIAQKQPDLTAYKAAEAKLDGDVDALKTHAQAQRTDPWAKIMLTPVEVFHRSVKDGEPKIESHDPEAFLTIVNTFVGLVEARQRALSRTMQRPPIPGLNPSSVAPLHVPARPKAE
ncbi:MAG TPA: DUF3829 domain-containing protein [Minicystis sp.]|nr:DUF3829 domain-containing protein [Minicystis sp.]